MAMRSCPVGGAGYLRCGVSGVCVRSTSRKELGDKGRRDRPLAEGAGDERKAEGPPPLNGGLRSADGEAEAVGEGDGELSETGRRLKAVDIVMGIGGVGGMNG